MVGDVPVGIFLSGGVDSSTAGNVQQSITGKKIDTFFSWFDENGEDALSKRKLDF